MKATGVKMERQSPVHLPGQPVNRKLRDHWPVIQEYADEGPGPWVVDLSHCRRWDIQGRDLDEAWVSALSLPDSPGSVILQPNGLTGRTGQKQAFLWLFDDKAAVPAGAGCTETTEGSLCLALLGKDVFHITEKLTYLDLGDPKRKAPFLVLGPFCHVTGQIVVLKNDPGKAAVLVACTRGFAHDMVDAVLTAGEEFGLRPAGERRFTEYIKSAPGPNRPVKPKTSIRKSTAAEKPRPPGGGRSKKTIV
jgi:hypothetical protein